MAATNRYKGTMIAATWPKTHPATATAITINGAKSIKYDANIEVKKEGADGDLGPTTCFWAYMDPTFALELINPYATAAITPDMRGTFAYTIADAHNGVVASGGGKSYSITNAYLMDANIDHTYREFGRSSVSFGTIWADGTTSPV